MSDLLEALTVEDVAALLKLAPKTIRALCKRGELRSVTVARRVRIPRAAVAALLDGATPPSSPAAPAWPELSERAPARRPRGRPRRSESTARSASSSPSSRDP